MAIDYNSYDTNFNNALGDFFKSGNYQLAYGNNTASDPKQRFLNDAGAQLALDQSQNAVGNAYAAKGLGQSGALGVGLQNSLFQNYNQWQSNQANMLGNYQNQLSGLANMGIGMNGATVAAQNGSQLAGLMSGNYSNLGNQLAGLYSNTGSNISSLLANQGVLGASGYLNTGAAISNNMFQTSQFGAQLQANQRASNAGSANSILQGQGAMNQANAYQGFGTNNPGGGYTGNPWGVFGTSSGQTINNGVF